MVKPSKVKVKPYTKKVMGKVYKVKGYSRKYRAKGKKAVKYRTIGVVEVGYDKYGNLMGSRLKKTKKNTKKAGSKKQLAKPRKKSKS